MNLQGVRAQHVKIRTDLLNDAVRSLDLEVTGRDGAGAGCAERVAAVS